MANQNYTDYAKLLGGLTGQEQQYDLGQSQQANAADRNANDFTLGKWGAENTSQRDWWNYDVNKEQNANVAANNQNNFNIQGMQGGWLKQGGSAGASSPGSWKTWGY